MTIIMTTKNAVSMIITIMTMKNAVSMTITTITIMQMRCSPAGEKKQHINIQKRSWIS